MVTRTLLVVLLAACSGSPARSPQPIGNNARVSPTAAAERQARPLSVFAHVIDTKVDAAVLVFTIDRGSDQGISMHWSVALVDSSGLPLRDREPRLIRVDKSTSMLVLHDATALPSQVVRLDAPEPEPEPEPGDI